MIYNCLLSFSFSSFFLLIYPSSLHLRMKERLTSLVGLKQIGHYSVSFYGIAKLRQLASLHFLQLCLRIQFCNILMLGLIHLERKESVTVIIILFTSLSLSLSLYHSISHSMYIFSIFLSQVSKLSQLLANNVSLVTLGLAGCQLTSAGFLSSLSFFSDLSSSPFPSTPDHPHTIYISPSYFFFLPLIFPNSLFFQIFSLSVKDSPSITPSSVSISETIPNSISSR